MLTSITTLLPLLVTSLLAGGVSAQVYWPDQLVQLGQYTTGPLGTTQNPDIQNKTFQNALEAHFDLPALPSGSTCTLGMSAPGKWNDNNSTWTAYLPNSPSPTYLRIDVLNGDVNPNGDTFANPAPSSFYGVMGLTIPGEQETGLNVSMDPPTVPCDASFSIWPLQGEMLLFWNQDPECNRGLQMIVTSPSP